MIKKTPHFLGFGEFFSFFRVASNNAMLNSKRTIDATIWCGFVEPQYILCTYLLLLQWVGVVVKHRRKKYGIRKNIKQNDRITSKHESTEN